MAREDAITPPPGDSVRVLLFRLAGNPYALRLSDVAEIIRAVAITPLPAGPDVVEGVIDVRGEMVPVFDLRRRWGCAQIPVDPREYMVIVRTGAGSAAIRVDAVDGLAALDPIEIRNPREFAPDAEYLTGMVTLTSGVVLIHDLHRFLSAETTRVLDQALRESRGTESRC